MDDEYREVDFHKYCKTCKYEKRVESEEPCNQCLENFINLHSQKPVRWEEK